MTALRRLAVLVLCTPLQCCSAQGEDLEAAFRSHHVVFELVSRGDVQVSVDEHKQSPHVTRHPELPQNHYRALSFDVKWRDDSSPMAQLTSNEEPLFVQSAIVDRYIVQGSDTIPAPVSNPAPAQTRRPIQPPQDSPKKVADELRPDEADSQGHDIYILLIAVPLSIIGTALLLWVFRRGKATEQSSGKLTALTPQEKPDDGKVTPGPNAPTQQDIAALWLKVNELTRSFEAFSTSFIDLSEKVAAISPAAPRPPPLPPTSPRDYDPEIERGTGHERQSNFNTARVEDVVREYADAVRRHDSAKEFFVRHNGQVLQAKAGRGGGPTSLVAAGTTEDPLSVPFWGIPFEPESWWVFPGFKQYAARSSFSAGGWHGAKETFKGLYELTTGVGFLRYPATVRRAGGGRLICTQPGTIELPKE